MNISIFLSYPKPFMKEQEEFISKLVLQLNNLGFAARTLGVTDYDINAPLNAIRRLMLESNGLITIAFRRLYIGSGISKPNPDLKFQSAIKINEKWITSPWAHIEPAMAFQLGLPILIIREKGVIDEGILAKGVVGVYMPEFNLETNIDKYFETIEWKEIIGKWSGYVRSVVEKKGSPPKLY